MKRVLFREDITIYIKLVRDHPAWFIEEEYHDGSREVLKENFATLDAAMNFVLRPGETCHIRSEP